MKGLAEQLIAHGKIRTTEAKAKELRPMVEKLVTQGKKKDVSSSRMIKSRLHTDKNVERLVSDISKKFEARSGGYTRIIKIGRRISDSAEMAIIELTK